jgi:hypothetical protein
MTTANIAAAISGVVSGIVFALSCGDNLSVGADADAAIDAAKAPDAAPPACDCPAAEPPLAGRFIVFHNTRTIPANDHNTTAAVCPMGSQPLFGSCTTDQLTPFRNVRLREVSFSSDYPREWGCLFDNNEVVPVTIRSSVTCLKPPPP